MAQDGQTVQSREHDIQDDQIGLLLPGKRQPFPAVFGKQQPVGLAAFEQAADEQGIVFIVIDDQDGGRPLV